MQLLSYPCVIYLQYSPEKVAANCSLWHRVWYNYLKDSPVIFSSVTTLFAHGLNLIAHTVSLAWELHQVTSMWLVSLKHDWSNFDNCTQCNCYNITCNWQIASSSPFPVNRFSFDWSGLYSPLSNNIITVNGLVTSSSIAGQLSRDILYLVTIQSVKFHNYHSVIVCIIFSW